MRKKKSNLDEMQEQKLLRIEKTGCWFAFWALLISMFVQMGIFGINKFKYFAGEWFVFMILALYLGLSCMKNGIWDRTFQPNGKTNFLLSLGSAVIFGLIFSIVNYMNYDSLEAAAATFAVMALILLISIFLALSLSSAIYKKRIKHLEEDYEDDQL